MRRFLTQLESGVGAKLLIGLTGLMLALFLVLHLAGNLLILVGPGPFNAYAHALVSNPFLIPAEIGLGLVFVLHVYRTIRMFVTNRRARPVGYERRQWAGHTSRKSWASVTMIVSGLVMLGFLVLHLRTFKFGPFYDAGDAAGSGRRDLHRLVVEVFSQPGYVVLYVICMALVGLHLRHGIASAFQSLGADHPRYTPAVVRTGAGLALVIGGGFALIPLWVFFFGGR